MIRGPHLPKLVFLFGLAGAGKNFCADAIAEALGYEVYDLDKELTPRMKAAIAAKRPFTDDMRDEFFAVVNRTMGELKAKHPWLIVTQGAYKIRHRDHILREHPDVTFVWIDAPKHIIMERLTSRGDSVSPEYASTIAKNFEPVPDGYRLLNDAIDKQTIVERFYELFEAH